MDLATRPIPSSLFTPATILPALPTTSIRGRCPKWINGILGSDGPFILRPKVAKIESPPQSRDWRSNKTFAEGDRLSAIVKNHSKLEVIAAGLRQLSESLEVTSIHGGARLDFDTDQCATSRFNHTVNLVLIFVPVVV